MTRKGRVPLAIVFPVGAGLCALWPTIPALVIWFHVVTRQPYDIFSGAFGGDVFVAGFTGIFLAIIAAVKGYHGAAVFLVLWAVGAMILILVGLNLVVMAPDG